MGAFRLAIAPRPRAGEVFDVIVVGAGPAGLTAALYSARFALKTLVVSEDVGGTLIDAGPVDDYLGLPSISGPDLAKRFEGHVARYRVPVVRGRVVDVRRGNGLFTVVTEGGDSFRASTVVIAVGSRRRRLNVPGEREFTGKGVSYCAPCDAPLFKDKVVAVVGGGNAALQAALLLSSYSSKVYLVHRRDSFRAFPVYVKLVRESPNIELILNRVVIEIGGSRAVEWVRLRNVVSGEEEVVSAQGVVVEIGSEPPKEFFKRIGLQTDGSGYVVVKPGQLTNIPGIFAAGDCTAGPFKKKFDQIVVASAEGAVAALSAYEYLMERRGAKVLVPGWG